MNERQKKTLKQAFTMLSAAAQRGKRLADDATLSEMQQHVDDLEALVHGMRESVGAALGAGSVLARVARAKTLSIGATHVRRSHE